MASPSTSGKGLPPAPIRAAAEEPGPSRGSGGGSPGRVAGRLCPGRGAAGRAQGRQRSPAAAAAGQARGAGPAPRQPTAAAARRVRRRDAGKPHPQPRAVGAKVRRAGRPRPAPSAVAPPPRPFPTAGPIPAQPRAREIARRSRRDEPGASRLLRPGADGNHWSRRPGPRPPEVARGCAARHTRAYLLSFRAAAAALPGSPRFNPGGCCCRRSRCQTPAGTSLPPDSRARPPRAAAAGGVTLLPPEPGPPAAASVSARPRPPP
ncbi:translation initiation factor IF-2-like [Motacilla alba alba]|uniref:translation initiation factor IF-2-like n=1 Tax=Motacilla alba alba TaxID=1094192 RepID=UPI0018D5A88E|nr:translation initiation factor IF-2-like [Motacilla alba alba]